MIELSSFMKKIILGQSNLNLISITLQPDDMRKYLFGLNNCVSSLTKEYDTLVGAALVSC